MKNTNTTYTYWRENRTGCIYKYEFGTKPYNADTAWTQVTGYEYDKALEEAYNKYIANA